MADPFVGEIRIVPYNFAPLNWAFCDGSLISIAQNQVLFALIGTTYGGDGVQTYALPDLRGRVPIHQGAGFIQGQFAGTQQVSLAGAQNAAHSHAARCDNTQGGTQISPAGALWSFDNSGQFGNYAVSEDGPNDNMNAGSLQPSGSGLPHENRQPYLGLHYIISMFGIFPSQN